MSFILGRISYVQIHTLFIWGSIDNSPKNQYHQITKKNLEPNQINRVKVKIERSANLRAE